MMTLSHLIKKLQKLESQGHGDKKVYTIHGASGCVSELSNPWLTNEVNETGPFDLEKDEYYISIYNGN